MSDNIEMRGDELQVTVEDKRIVNAVPCRGVPTHLVSPEVAAAIEESRREIKANETGDEHELARRIREASRSTSAIEALREAGKRGLEGK